MRETIAAMCNGPVDEATYESTSDSAATNCGSDRSVIGITRRRNWASVGAPIQSSSSAIATAAGHQYPAERASRSMAAK